MFYLIDEKRETGELGTSFVEYWSTIWSIAFFETFDTPWRRDQRNTKARENQRPMEILEEDNIPWHEIDFESVRVFTNIAFTARNIFLDDN